MVLISCYIVCVSVSVCWCKHIAQSFTVQKYGHTDVFISSLRGHVMKEKSIEMDTYCEGICQKNKKFRQFLRDPLTQARFDTQRYCYKWWLIVQNNWKHTFSWWQQHMLHMHMWQYRNTFPVFETSSSPKPQSFLQGRCW